MEATDWQEQFCGAAPHARPLSGELYLSVCISRSWLYTPLLLLSVTSWEVSISFSFLLPLPIVRIEHLCTTSLPTWEEGDGGYNFCPSRSACTLRIGVCAWLVLMWYSFVRIYWMRGVHCASLQAPLLHLCLQVGVVPLEWERPAVLSYFLFLFFICCLDMWMELKRWNSKWESHLCSSKKAEALCLCPWRGLAFTSHMPASRWYVIALQKRRFQWYILPSRWEEVWCSCVSGLEEEIIVFR